MNLRHIHINSTGSAFLTKAGLRRKCPIPVCFLYLVIMGSLALVSCANKDQQVYLERSLEELYNTGLDHLDDGDYKLATDLFLEVERQHPYSIWAIKSQLMGAYSFYSIGEYDDAILALDRFIQLHPGNKDVSYAYYLKGLCYYEQITDVGRDQRITELALASLSEVVQRFPKSKYARDAKLKIDLTHDHLAGKEMEVGRFYLKREQYLAAINRFKNVIENYQSTTHTPEALHRMTEAFKALGIDSEARKNAAVLGHNFPGSQWYSDSYELLENIVVRDVDGDGIIDPVPEKHGFFSRLWPF